jgi:hypothetical protein
VQAGTSGSINVFSANASADVIIDINGYYSYTVSFALGGSFPVLTTTGAYAIWGSNTVTNGVGIWGTDNNGTGSIGVKGTSDQGIGVYGSSTSGTQGVGGFAGGTGTVFGVQGQISASGGAGSAGVHGIGANVTGKSYGVLGETSDANGDSAAVQGLITGTGVMVGNPGNWVQSGIRGDAAEIGVWGFANTWAVVGRAYTTGGVLSGLGTLGENAGTTTYGVHGTAGTSGTTNWAVYASGNMGASGAKPFVEPHPTQAGVVIRYVALEGPEAGTYFRGRGRFVGREAVIEVPEDFRLVTDGEGLTIQVTPIGDLSQVAVVSMGLDTIELKSSRDVEFFYHVNGVRKTFKDWKVMVSGNEFMPAGQNAKMPDGLSDEQKRSLIRNGTYNGDGTPNMATAQRLGWDVEWSRRAAQDMQVAPKTEK